MKITISVPGRFHGFDLALQIEKNYLLDQFITSYPKFYVKKYGIKTKNIRSIVAKEIIIKFFNKFFNFQINSILLNIYYDFITSRIIHTNSDIYILWAGFSLLTIKKIRKKNPNAIIILERGSTHISFQREIILNAYKNFSEIKPLVPSFSLIKREIQEYDLVDFISTPTAFTKKTFLTYNINEKKIFTNPYGVDLKKFSHRNKSNKINNFTVLFTGFFCVRKGADIFIKILHESSKIESLNFKIVGTIEKKLYKYLQPYIKSGKLTYVSHLPQEKLISIYNDADVFLFPSYEEGLAIVLLQALASGLFIIATENSGAKSLYDSGQIFISDFKDIDSITKILKELSENRNSYLNVNYDLLEKYSWNNYGKRSIDFYQKCLLNKN